MPGEVQGVMAVDRTLRPARFGNDRVVYVDYLEAAPWNLKGIADPPRFLGVGTVLLVEAVRLSVETGHGGRVGLHSLPQSEPFYIRCRMSRVGPDPEYYDLTYFEYTEQQAADWLASIGEAYDRYDPRDPVRQAAEAEGGMPISAGAGLPTSTRPWSRAASCVSTSTCQAYRRTNGPR